MLKHMHTHTSTHSCTHTDLHTHAHTNRDTNTHTHTSSKVNIHRGKKLEGKSKLEYGGANENIDEKREIKNLNLQNFFC